ncbi:hypothetical protein [Nostoc sp. CCY 9925]
MKAANDFYDKTVLEMTKNYGRIQKSNSVYSWLWDESLRTSPT